ncbi:unnamed protein product [Gongylonema pulchrum]|uniref:TPR_REGION domain-containing protein n=1 Tax=Gongylonema pulchrum TaxID=637853 RepID=A0A183E417_9BILA|nr:unnamed protein product [Gongylonema pulchrum]
MREEPSNSDVSGLVRSKEFENVIHCHLQHFAVSDAIVLAELYHETVKTVDSLYLFAHCLVRGTRIEAAYNLLKFDGVCSTPEIRYLFAHCCCLLDNETGRPDEAADEAKLALKQNVFSWTSLKTLCDLGTGNPESIYASLLSSVNKAHSANKTTAPEGSEVGTQNAQQQQQPSDSPQKKIQTDEAKLALKQNVFSWTSLKTLCDLGTGNPESIYASLLSSVNKAHSANKTTAPESSEVGTQNAQQQQQQQSDSPHKKTQSTKETEPKIIPLPTKKTKTGVATRRNVETGNISRRRLEEGVETRRSTRLFGASQDSENQTTGKKILTRSRVAGLSTGGTPRSFQDKQLR